MMMPKLYTSAATVYGKPPRISGASHRGLLATMLLSTTLSSITRDKLKSHTCAAHETQSAEVANQAILLTLGTEMSSHAAVLLG